MNELFGSLILTTGIILAPEIGNSGDASAGMKALAKATYKQSHMDKKMNELEKMYVNDDVKKYGGYSISVTKLMVERYISYEWRF